MSLFKKFAEKFTKKTEAAQAEVIEVKEPEFSGASL